MNNAATSRETLLDASLRLASEKGLSALGMRDIAKACGISVGCVYRYFPSKAELIAATVERIWQMIFSGTDEEVQSGGFPAHVRWVYACIARGSQAYPSFLAMHADAFAPGERAEGRAMMSQYMKDIMEGLLGALKADENVREDAFDEDFTRETFVSFVFQNLLMFAQRRAPTCDDLIAVIRRIAY